MEKHNKDLYKRLSLMFTSEKRKIFLKNFFYIAKNMQIFYRIFHWELSTRSKNLILEQVYTHKL